MRLIIEFTGTEDELDVLTPARLARMTRAVHSVVDQVTSEFELKLEGVDPDDGDDVMVAVDSLNDTDRIGIHIAASV